jgi:uncharacterized membrane protein
LSWLWLGLATALFYGLQGVWTKWIIRRVSGPAASWAIFAFAFPVLAIYLAIQGAPESVGPRFWPALLTNVTINLVSFYLYVSAIQKSDLGLTYPLLALTPIFVMPIEWVLLGDLPGLQGAGGILLVVTGVYLLNFSERRSGILAPLTAVFRDPGARRMLAVAVIWSISAVVDKVATISSSTAFYGTLQTGLIGLAFAPLVMRRGEGFKSALSRRTGWLLAIQGLLFALMFIVQMEALRRVFAAYVISIKRSGAIVTVILGALLFGEPRLRERLAGAVVILAGVLLIAGA